MQNLSFDSQRGYVYRIEGEVHDDVSWQRSLNISADKFNSLAREGIFRRVQANYDGRCHYSLQLVGAAFTDTFCLIALPKTSRNLAGDKNRASDFSLTVKVIERYRAEIKRRPSLTSLTPEPALTGPDSRLIDLFNALLRWTDLHGFHKEEQHGIVERNGAVNWAETLRTGLALHGQGFTVYDSPILKRRRRIEGRLYPIQIRTICQLNKFLGPLASVLAGSRSEVLHEAEAHSRGLERNTHQQRHTVSDIKEFLRTANQDHERELANILLGIYKRHTIHQRIGTTVYGSTAFGFIWQAINARIFLAYKSGTSYTTLSCGLRQHIGDAVNSWLMPDHILNHPIYTDNLMILDSKWHLPESTYSAEDVTKQLMYELAIKAECTVVGNAFLSPSDGEEVEFLGEIKPWIDNGKDPRFPAIRVVGVPWRKAFLAYLDNKTEMLAQSVIKAVHR
jgi:hypothetical protein